MSAAGLRSSRRSAADAPPDKPDQIEEVKAQARQLLGDDMGKFRVRDRSSGFFLSRAKASCDLCPAWKE